MKHCFLIGHKDAGSEIYASLSQAVHTAFAQYHTEEFLVGHYGKFDHMASKAILELKKTYPRIRVYRLIAYYNAAVPETLPEGFDGTIYLIEGNPPKKSHIVVSNLRAIDSSFCLVAYVRHPGKSRDFLDYAKNRAEKGLIHILEI